jgi:hypothetical protein
VSVRSGRILLPSLLCAIVAAGSTTPVEGRPGCPQLEPRIRTPARFVEGLAGAWVPMEARDCLYVVAARMTRPVPVFRSPAGRRLHGPVWSPTRPEVAVAYRRARSFEVAVLDTHGRPLRRLLGRDATYLRDGRLVLGRSDGLWIVDGRLTPRRLVERRRLERAAGFSIVGSDLSVTDGYGRAGVIVSVWGAGVSRLLIVRADATVIRATPIFRAGGGTSMPGPPAWSPDGRVLLVPWQRDDLTGRSSHVHCLARWTAARGYRPTVCRNQHFDRVIWHPDGGTALLNNGLVVGRDGQGAADDTDAPCPSAGTARSYNAPADEPLRSS